MTTVFLSRACEGCGKVVPLDEWQAGPLGCDDCRRHIVSVTMVQGRFVTIEVDDPRHAGRLCEFWTSAMLARSAAA